MGVVAFQSIFCLHSVCSYSCRVWVTAVLPRSFSRAESRPTRGHCGLVWHHLRRSAKASCRLFPHTSAQLSTVSQVDSEWSKRQLYCDADSMRQLTFDTTYVASGLVKPAAPAKVLVISNTH